MITDTFCVVAPHDHELSNRLFDLKPRVIKPYLAECPHCGDRFPYHPELFPTCGNPDCPRLVSGRERNGLG